MMSLADAAGVTEGRTSGGNPVFAGVSTDSRTLRPGELFVALRGEHFDGHAFLAQAKAAGACAAMVDRAYGGEYPIPVLIVADTKLALGALARGWRARFDPVLIAVTGSNGKTTVKEMLASILRAHATREAAGEHARHLRERHDAEAGHPQPSGRGEAEQVDVAPLPHVVDGETNGTRPPRVFGRLDRELVQCDMIRVDRIRRRSGASREREPEQDECERSLRQARSEARATFPGWPAS